MAESPPPMIVQLRQNLAGAILNPSLLRDPVALQIFLDESVAACDWLMDQHPDLVGDYFRHRVRQ